MGVGVNGNLIPPKKGEVRNPKGKPKGTKHLSTWIQEMMNDEDFEVYLQHPTKGYEEFKGAPVKAIIKTAIMKAASNDASAREWLAKHGYGQTINLNTENPIELILNKYGDAEGGVNDIPAVEETKS